MKVIGFPKAGFAFLSRPEIDPRTGGTLALRMCEGVRLPEGWVCTCRAQRTTLEHVAMSPRRLQHTGRGCRENVFQYLERLFGNLRNRLHWSNKPAMYIGECWLPRCRSQSGVRARVLRGLINTMQTRPSQTVRIYACSCSELLPRARTEVRRKAPGWQMLL